ncbi:polysaccharide biosynthesis protein [Litoribacter ruber]|uniref:polysaccharide biosynthesis protein n=1 Tax=Litoribacter ruber TaxID=702568 RepID=UPI001BDB610F|nr:nucleoside-diphosphate sugar epimerase/dehydratase [Litoribacter ruber]MBT0810571.1 polysaccharide biosynthesis protein [Litoribacter ruber]
MEFLSRVSILPRWAVALFDSLILVYAIFIGFTLRYNFDFSGLEAYSIPAGLMLFLISGWVAMLITKSYLGIIRHTSLRDGVILAKMVVITSVLATLANFTAVHFLGQEWILSSAVLLISAGVALMTLLFYRMIIKELFGYIKHSNKDIIPVAVFGAGEAGVLAQEIYANDNQVKKRVVAFLDDDPNKAGKILSGAKIYLGLEILASVVAKYKIRELVISVQELSPTRRRQIIDECLRLNVHATIIPPVKEWINGSLGSNEIREVKIEDLLSREEIGLDNDQVKNDIAGRVIMVTGAAGSIGSQLIRQLQKYNPRQILLVDQAESPLYTLYTEVCSSAKEISFVPLLADIRKRKGMSRIISKYRPQIIYHAAAYKHVPMMEEFPEEAIKANILGTRTLADLAVINHVEKFVMVSTDKAVNPTNVMGASKRIAEMYVQALNDAIADTGDHRRTRFVTTRFGNVLGSNGSVIPLFKNQIKNGGPVTVTHPNITRYFMTIPEACQLVIEAGVMGNGGEVFVFDMGEPIKILDLAKKMIQLSGKKLWKDIGIEFSGLRQGEKLYEELLTSSEKVIETHHPKIMIAKVKKVNFEAIVNKVEAFKVLLDKNSDIALVSHMKKIVPEYISNASRFSFLDKMELKQ